MKEIKVQALMNGTVIDHIPADEVFKVVEVLHLEKEFLAIGVNFSSHKMGEKGLIKIADKELSQHELNKLALIAPNATVNIIKNTKVTGKRKIELPGMVENILRCGNAGCVTRHENIKTRFHVISKKPVTLKCHYCEKDFGKKELALL